MIRLDFDRKPKWLQMVPGVRLRLSPMSTALMMAARADDALRDLPEDADSDHCGMVFARALARRAVLDWEGVGDADGNVAEVTPEGIDALLDIFPIFDAFQTLYVSKGLMLDAEGNAFAPSPTGTSAGAPDTAKPARARAKTARRG